MIANSIDDSRSKSRVIPLSNGYGWNYQILFDNNENLKRALNIHSIPHTIIMDNSEIFYRHSGYKEGDEYLLINNFHANFSLFVDDIYNYGNDIKFDRIHYYTLGGTYTNGNNRLSISYGRQRGGLICLGGICRFVPNSTGLSIGISTSLY